HDADLRRHVLELRKNAAGRLVVRAAVEPFQRDRIFGEIRARADIDQAHAAEQAATRAALIGSRTRVAHTGAIERHATDVGNLDRRTGVRPEDRHFDHFDVAFLRPVKTRTALVVIAADKGEVHEVDAGRRKVRVVRDRAGLVERDYLAAAGTAWENGRGPHVLLRQEQVEVEHFTAVLAFEEADLDRLR